jgi:hypothetical protein
MNRPPLLLLLALSTTGALSPSQPTHAQSARSPKASAAKSSTSKSSAAWKTFSPKGGGFSALLPGTPKAERKEDKDQDKGTIRLRVFWAGRRLYLAMAAFPDGASAARDAERFHSSLRLLKAHP